MFSRCFAFRILGWGLMIGMILLGGRTEVRGGERSRGDAAPAPAGHGLIQQFGTFPSRDGRLVLKVSRQEKSIVFYELVLAREGRTVLAKRGWSDAMRWCFYWDEEGQLWAYSSDMQLFFKVKVTDDGRVLQESVERTGGRYVCPAPVFSFLPERMRKPL